MPPMTSNRSLYQILVVLNLISTVVPPTLILHDYGSDMCHSFDVSETDEVDQLLH